jgi:hypothetical protein
MIPIWLHIIGFAWLVISFICALIIIFDLATGHRQKMAIMNVVWPITALYFGLFGLWTYWKLGRPAAQSGMRDGHARQKPFWQAIFVGSTHCGAGCTIGDLIGEWMVFVTGFVLAGSALLAYYVGDFVFAYVVGIAFQYFAIAPMKHLSLRDGVMEAVKADTLSLAAFEIGMFAWMALVSRVLFHPELHPDSTVYWFMMQIGMAAGLATTFPANWFLIRRGVKTEM